MRLGVEHLQYLVAAAEAGSFRRAAEMFQTRQANVSRAVRQIEDQLGVSLFERAFSGVRLTQAGRNFVDQVVPALNQLEFAERAAGAAGRAEVGTLRIGILTSLAGGFLRQLLQSYSSRHPEVLLDVHDGGRRDHLAALRARRLDVAFVTGSGQIPEFETSELWRERVHVALSREHPLTTKSRLDWPELKTEHFIVCRAEPGPEVRDYIVRRAADYSTYPVVEHKTTTQDTLMNLVSLGQGITLVSAAWTAVKVPDLELRPLTARADIVPFSAVWSPSNDNPALRRFLSVAHVLAGRHRKGCSDWVSIATAS